MLRTMLATLTSLGLCAAADAQVSYGGYDLGPDYGAMLDQAMQQQAALQQQMQQAEMAVVQQAMHNPDCVAKYRQHLATGGQMSYQEFAYRYAATGGMTSDGIARFQRSERINQVNEYNAWLGVRDAERARGQAQADLAAGFAHNQHVAGQVMQGRQNWIDPYDGQARTLDYIGPNSFWQDQATGRYYHRDGNGHFRVMGPDGGWYDMAPAR